MKITKEIKTAIIVLTSIFIFIWGYNFLRGRDIFSRELKVFSYFDNVEGLSTASQVTFNGLVIGQVKSITYDAVKNQHFVEFRIDKKYPISKSTIVRIYEPGFISGKQLKIVPNFDDKTLVKSGDVLKGEIEIGQIAKILNSLGPLQQMIESMIDNANVFVTNLNSVFDAKTRQNVHDSMDNLNKSLAELAIFTRDAKDLLSNNKTSLNNTLKDFETTTSNFKKFSNNLNELELKRITDNLETSLKTIDKLLADLNKGEGTMGKLLKDDRLYNNLSGASRELELLLADVKAQPKRYVHFSVFGSKDKSPLKGKDSITIKIDN